MIRRLVGGWLARLAERVNGPAPAAPPLVLSWPTVPWRCPDCGSNCYSAPHSCAGSISTFTITAEPGRG